jgi:hypothetical protein
LRSQKNIPEKDPWEIEEKELQSFKDVKKQRVSKSSVARYKRKAARYAKEKRIYGE